MIKRLRKAGGRKGACVHQLRRIVPFRFVGGARNKWEQVPLRKERGGWTNAMPNTGHGEMRLQRQQIF